MLHIARVCIHVLKEPKHAPTNALQIDGQKPRSCTACYVAARCHTFLYLCFTLALGSFVQFRMPLWGLSEKTKTRNLRGVCSLTLPAIEGIVFRCFRLLPFFRSRSLGGLSSSTFWEPRWGVRRGKWQLQEFWTSWRMMHWNRWKRTFKESKDGWGISSAGFFVESICSFTEATDFPIGSDFHMAPPASLPETNHLQRWCCRGLWKILAGPGSQASSVPCLCFRLVPPPPAVVVDPPPMDVWPEDPVCQLAGCLKGVGWSLKLKLREVSRLLASGNWGNGGGFLGTRQTVRCSSRSCSGIVSYLKATFV